MSPRRVAAPAVLLLALVLAACGPWGACPKGQHCQMGPPGDVPEGGQPVGNPVICACVPDGQQPDGGAR